MNHVYRVSIAKCLEQAVQMIQYAGAVQRYRTLQIGAKLLSRQNSKQFWRLFNNILVLQ